MVAVRNVDVAQAVASIASGAVLLDVREDDEWAAGHAPVATHLPLGRLGEIEERPGSHHAPIVVICRSGNRSTSAAAALMQAGYDAVNMAGGMRAWAQAGQPIVDESGQAGTVI
jgi:rhodanese-related sulfurtransferase